MMVKYNTTLCRQILISTLLCCGLWGIAAAAGYARTQVDADTALKKLQEGHRRFLEKKTISSENYLDRIKATSIQGQTPFATILSCSDSRVPSEIIFDQGIGDLFIVRVAGNVVEGGGVGTIEFGVGALGTPLVVVMGHTKCGLIEATINKVPASEHIRSLTRQVRPIVSRIKAKQEALSKEELLKEVTKCNVFKSIEIILHKSKDLRRAALENKVKFIGAIYDVSTGEVHWLGPHPSLGKLL